MNSMDKVNAFRDARNWRQFHNEKDLALSISLEASELLEIFQWGSAEEGVKRIDEIKDELADVLIYTYMLIDNLSFNINELVERKLIKNNDKYPVKGDTDITGLEWNPDMTTMEKAVYFRTVRGWTESNNAKSIVISIVLEVSELLEIYQWKTAEEGNKNIEALQDEIADILIYGYTLADHLSLDVDELIERKLIKNNEKYPVL